ncbi:hypothetical protein ADIMK_3951 [Marinobacterium lacunae]|uniref:Uncharacterized protein n=1 Tax=Marinobacterium lacunae TaxID=1232683 RepID=A0A081FTE9_9GAMM|nr:HupE/UreJ family protein [Marinobacterium lacunae]KEA61804.1 hypothetical protein ADIMK_3951 [Marinobacterium lacunae]
MKNLKHCFAVSALIAPGAAFAHEGEHAGSFFSGLGHVLTEPDHLAIVFALAAVLGTFVWARRVIAKKAKARSKRAARVQE